MIFKKIVVAYALIQSTFLYASDLRVVPTKDNIQFTAVGKPGFLKIVGKEAAMQGHAQVTSGKVSGSFDVPLDEFKTGIDMRDEHMKNKYLETKKYPKAIFEVKDLTVPSKGSGEVDFTGDLILHGVKKTVSGKATIDWKNPSEAKVKGEFEIILSDYKIDIPSYLSVKVADKVDVVFDFVARN